MTSKDSNYTIVKRLLNNKCSCDCRTQVELRAAEEIEHLNSLVESLQNKWATRPLSHPDGEALIADNERLRRDNDRLQKAHDHQYEMAGLMLREAERYGRELAEALERELALLKITQFGELQTALEQLDEARGLLSEVSDDGQDIGGNIALFARIDAYLAAGEKERR